MEGLKELDSDPGILGSLMEKMVQNPVGSGLIFALLVTMFFGIDAILRGEGKLPKEGESRAPDDYYIV